MILLAPNFSRLRGKTPLKISYFLFLNSYFQWINLLSKLPTA